MPLNKNITALFLSIVVALSVSCSRSSTPLVPNIPNDNDTAEVPPPATDNPQEPSAEEPSTPGVPLVPPVPSGNLADENIGTKTRIYDLFDRWTLKSAISSGRGSQYADVTVSCHGKIDLDYALTAQQWNDQIQRKNYYRNVSALIDRVGAQILADNGNVLKGTEKDNFLKALKALAWQESRWQHYVRYKDWFFLFLSGGSYNVLDDWGISQVARSGFTPGNLLNAAFFSSGKYCGISTTLYYGFTEYYNNYLEARSASCNQTGNEMDKLLGAYNRYSSGYSPCYNGYSSDAAYRSYQINAMNGLKSQYLSIPWINQM